MGFATLNNLGRVAIPEPLRLSFAPMAEVDLEDIVRYSDRQWGEDQTIKYTSAMFDEAARLTHFPLTGRMLEGLDEETRALPVGSHVLIYRVTSIEIRILRILHERRITRLLLKSL